MPQLRNTRHRDLQHVSDAYPIFGLCLRNENREANGHQAPFDAAAQDAAEDIDMEIIAQSGIPHGSNSLLGRGLWVKFFKAPDGRQRACIAIVPSDRPDKRSARLAVLLLSTLALCRSVSPSPFD